MTIVASNSTVNGAANTLKEVSFWEEYKLRLVSFLSLSLLEALLIAVLLVTIARRRKAEKERARFASLADAEHQRLDETVANVPGIVWESRVESDGNLRRDHFVSQYVEKMLGYTTEEWLSSPRFWLSIILEEDRDRVAQENEAIFTARGQGILQYRCRRKDGRVIWVEAQMATIVDEQGKAVGMRGVTMDISERLQAEEEVRERRQELDEAQRLAKLGNWMWDRSTDTVIWSEEMYRIAGRDPALPAVSYKEHPHLYTSESWERLRAAVETALQTGAPYELELELVRADGKRIWTNARGEVQRDASGEIVKLRGTLQDITERKQSEQALQTALAEVSDLKDQLQAEIIYLREEIKLEHNFDEMIGTSDALKSILHKIEQVAATNSTVLLLGESGTGKELAARAIHHTSARKDRPLVKVNCSALPATLIESELFGHEKGAFTGAASRQVGRFELADGATLFLDEIGDLPLELQSKLLRVLQEGEIERLGSARTIKVDVRIIAATNRNLQAEVQKGLFREDLWYRLNVFPITVPPLRQRKEDIPLLVEHFAQRFAKKLGKPIHSISLQTMEALQSHSWPGNIRELANVIERAVIKSSGSTLRVEEKLEAPRQMVEMSFGGKTLEALERDYITFILDEVGWKIEGADGAAHILGLHPSTLRTRMAKLGIQKPHKNAV